MKRTTQMQRSMQNIRATNQGADAPRSPGAHASQRREGSTLMIVIALLAMLSLLGVVFYTFAAQERSNAEYFAASAKVRPCEIPADVYFNFALRQLIVGPNKNEVQSALWGGRHSMVINMLGYEPGQAWDPLSSMSSQEANSPFRPEAHPFTGSGIHLYMDGTTGDISVDQDHDGAPDPIGSNDVNGNGIHDFIEDNLSLAARWNESDMDFDLVNPLNLPQPDVDYTAADHNSLFESYDGYGIAGGGSPRRVLVPSFFRPWKVRNIANWWGAGADHPALTLRPHRSHVDVVATNNAGTQQLLYVKATDADAGQFNAAYPFNATLPKMGSWTNDGGGDPADWDYDVDNDQDGFKEGVWMYLGFPIQRCPDGSAHVALHSFTVIDLDSLLNLNMHGNSPDIDSVVIDGTAFGGNQFLSKSNQGIGPGEVNLQHGLYAQPLAAGSPAMAPYEQFYGGAPLNRQQLSNQEFFFLTRGRPEFSGSGDTQSDITDLFPGRYGEEQARLFNSIRTMAGASMNAGNFPKPGRFGINDQGNFFDPNSESPRFLQPLAYNGAGSYTLQHLTGTNGDYRYLAIPTIPGNPNNWLRYTGYNARQLPLWGTALSGALMQSTTGNAEVDDAEEIIVDRRYLQSSDAVFAAGESAFLQMSQAALDKLGVAPRVENLMPYTLGSHTDRRTTAKRLASVSADRKTFGFARTQDPINPNEFARRWEFNADADSDGKLEFPPQFGNATPNSNNNTNRDPFREQLRAILNTEEGRSPAEGLRQFRLNINRLLYRDSTGNLNYRQLTSHPDDPGTTPLPDSMTWNQGNVNYPPTTAREQEFWARVDRQTMARDIYVLLYTLGGGNDFRDYTQPNTILPPPNDDDTVNDPDGSLGLKRRVLYDDFQLREMAQFAVNMVDALDRDNIMTRFEYDKNLGIDSGSGSGWNLDDLPFDNSGDSTPPADRGVVHGLEAQQLTFSEALAVYAEKSDSSGTASDHAVTQWNDDQDTYFTHLELRNVSPYSVNFDNGASGDPSDNGAWQIEVEAVSTSSPVANRRYLTIKRDTTGSIGAGGLFSIKSIGGLNIAMAGDRFQDPISGTDQPANIMIDHDYVAGTTPMPIYDYRVSPLSVSGSELDLIFPVAGRTNRYQLTNAVDNSGTPFVSLLDQLNVGVPDGGTRITFRLRRRLHPGRGTPANPTSGYNADNPWVAVDETTIVFDGGVERLRIDDTTEMNGADFADNFNDVRSRERVQSLDRDPTQTMDHTSGASFQRNSFGINNTRSAATFTLWQPQIDRDFASIGELLSIPLYGPDDATDDIRRNSLNPLIPPGTNYTQGTHLAAARFLAPKHASNYIDINTGNPKTVPPSPGTGNGTTQADLDFDNRWYRLLEFVEVPTRTHLHLPLLDPQANTALDVPLVPGKLNPNMFRHPEVLAGLLDDPQVAGDGNAYMLSTTYMNNPNGTDVHMPDRIESGRDWWEQFIYARDREDPVTSLYLPGLPGSRPFHSFSYSPSLEAQVGNTSYTVEGLDSTLLRGLGSTSGGDERRLFEIGTATDYNRGNNTTAYRNPNRTDRPVETTVRHKLLSKIAGNTTPRSHAFVVFVSVAFFEAQTTSNGALRIGGRLPGAAADSVDHRGVFVVNRALIDDAYDSTTGQIDWNKLVEYRLTVK